MTEQSSHPTGAGEEGRDVEAVEVTELDRAAAECAVAAYADPLIKLPFRTALVAQVAAAIAKARAGGAAGRQALRATLKEIAVHAAHPPLGRMATAESLGLRNLVVNLGSKAKAALEDDGPDPPARPASPPTSEEE
jgi:hypothetical protein